MRGTRYEHLRDLLEQPDKVRGRDGKLYPRVRPLRKLRPDRRLVELRSKGASLRTIAHEPGLCALDGRSLSRAPGGLALNAVQRQVAVLTAAGYTADEVSRKLRRVSVRTVQRYRSLPDVKLLVQEKESTGLEPADVLEALMYSPNEQVRMRAAIELQRLRSDPAYRSPGATAGAPRVTVYEVAS